MARTMTSLVRGGLGVGDRKPRGGRGDGEDDEVQQALILRKQQHLRIAGNNKNGHQHHYNINNKGLHPKQQRKTNNHNNNNKNGGGNAAAYKSSYHYSGTTIPSMELSQINTLPWFLCASLVIIVTAIFMRLIATNHAHEKRMLQQKQTILFNKAAARKRHPKPKTDQYNEDDDLLSASVRGSSSTRSSKKKPTCTASSSSTSRLYYPYHQEQQQSKQLPASVLAPPPPVQFVQPPPPLQQQQQYPRYRGAEGGHPPHPPAPVSSNTAATTSTTMMMMNAAAAAAATTAAATPAVTASSRHSYYLNPSCNTVILPSTTSSSYNNNHHHIPASPPSSSSINIHHHPPHHHHHRYRPPSPTVPAINNNNNNSANPTAAGLQTPDRLFSHVISTPAAVVADRSQALLHARPLSTTASSFASLIHPASQEEDEDDDIDELHTAQTPRSSLREYRRGGDEDHDGLYQDDIEATPRIVNNNNNSNAPDAIEWGMADSTSSPTAATTTTTTRLVPFVPSLDRVEPPKSVDLDVIRRFPTNFYNQFDASAKQLQDDILAAAAGESMVDDMPPDDPHRNNGIQHIRPDVTEDTNSSESLQLAIDFSEIKLFEVIGGGGFGQVHRAVWKGTPVAVKILTGSAQSKGVLQEFAAELNLLRGMRHPNVCLLMGACLEPPHRAIVTELAAYGSLWDALRLPLHPPYAPCDGTTRDGWPDALYRPDSRHGVPPMLLPSPSMTRQLKLPQPAVPHVGAWRWALVHKVACGAARGMACTYPATDACSNVANLSLTHTHLHSQICTGASRPFCIEISSQQTFCSTKVTLPKCAILV